MAFNLCRRLLWRRLPPWRRFGAVMLAAVIALPSLAAPAEAAARHAVLVVDANTGRALYQKSADAPRHPASLTKLMTLYLLFELIEQGRLSLTSKITFSANAVAVQPSKLGVEAGTEITVIDAIKALIVKSANDVAIAVAEHIAGSEEQFAALMTRKAHELGMKATEFRNASGLPDRDQVTTARDMMTLALRLYDQFPEYYPLFATRTFTWGDDTYRNHNRLLFRYKGLDGMKTGYIRASGFNLVASARRGKKHVLVAYFGGKTAGRRNKAVRARLDAAFAKASARKTRQPAFTGSTQAKAAPRREKVAEQSEGAEGASVAFAAAPPPQPVQRASTAPAVEVARVRPVLAAMPAPTLPVPDADGSPPASPSAQASTEATASSGPFHVQVGAFHSRSEAARLLVSVRKRAGTVLAAHAPRTTQVQHGDKVLFRARYVGFDARAGAVGVCSELKRMEIDCLVMKAE